MKTRRELAAEVRALAHRMTLPGFDEINEQTVALLIECAAGLIESQTLDESHTVLLEAVETLEKNPDDKAAKDKAREAAVKAHRFQTHFPRDKPA